MNIPTANRTPSPCMGCETRAENCRASCGKYAAYRAELDDKRQRRKMELIRDGMTLPGIKNELHKRDKDRLQRRTQGRR